MGTLHFSLHLRIVWSTPSHLILFTLKFYPGQYTSFYKYCYNAACQAEYIKSVTTNSKINIQKGKMIFLHFFYKFSIVALQNTYASHRVFVFLFSLLLETSFAVVRASVTFIPRQNI